MRGRDPAIADDADVVFFHGKFGFDGIASGPPCQRKSGKDRPRFAPAKPALTDASPPIEVDVPFPCEPARVVGLWKIEQGDMSVAVDHVPTAFAAVVVPDALG